LERAGRAGHARRLREQIHQWGAMPLQPVSN
jgi:hypothetical protein